ncbi:GntR family transcriptional regulator [Pseudemcibacter aquimaris]|uniref:GntR family transcriptional regulator n=1 Tax=Pseudemcibacter aquimaris TaxID=2857064 RepID=UPI002012CB2C|nr:GntR family transcriptional regulator [Pseudemcibacter aquimaris]MCC3862102.1 GntR family transcriptional regulator [Pseudemcibacter aquimaris]WDU58855.1 GntR family transcriptional regulator [Pseudemcibacter aquimaris]
MALTNTVDNQPSEREITHETVYNSLYEAIISGKFGPGRTLTIRGLAEELNVSPMPVREAIRRLVALGALEMRSTRRVSVASMTDEKYREIVHTRTILEPEIAALAMANCDDKLIKTLEKIDLEISEAIDNGDPDAYSERNREFHFTLYKAANSPIMLRLIESIWLQFGPFMRVVVGRLGTSLVIDQHICAIDALKKGDEQALREAIRLDIYDGMDRIGMELLGHTSSK